MSPGTDTERLDISPEACRLEVRRNAGRGTLWRVAYGNCSVLGARVVDSDVRVDNDDNKSDHREDYGWYDYDDDNDDDDDDEEEEEETNDCNVVT